MVVLNLLEKYRIDGIDSVIDPKVFDTPPFKGNVLRVAEEVGGLDNLKKIIEQIQEGMYRNDQKRLS